MFPGLGAMIIDNWRIQTAVIYLLCVSDNHMVGIPIYSYFLFYPSEISYTSQTPPRNPVKANGLFPLLCNIQYRNMQYAGGGDFEAFLPFCGYSGPKHIDRKSNQSETVVRRLICKWKAHSCL
jgi:hypothetical protein